MSLTLCRQYPIQPGILHNGCNTIAVSLWALDESGLRLGPPTTALHLEVEGVLKTSLDMEAIKLHSPEWQRRANEGI
jgi:hypothetical protein